MSYVVTLEGFRPPPRHDADPWTGARIEEAPASTGPWTTIESYVLVPDTDPTRPNARDFTSDLATLPTGWYRVVFYDASGDETTPSDAVFSGAAVGFRPDLNVVGALIRPRTRDVNGNEQGTFTIDTVPTAVEVESLIDQSIRQVMRKTGPEIPEELYDDARDVVACRTALQIELTYFPEQVATRRSPYEQMKELCKEGFDSLVEAVKELETGGEIGPEDDARLPSFFFPEDKGGMVGWQTEW